MQHFVEFVRVRVKPAAEKDFLDGRPDAIAGVRRQISGFVDAPVIAKVADEEWGDVWIYQAKEDAERADERASDIPEFMRMAELSEVISIETGWSDPEYRGERGNAESGTANQCCRRVKTPAAAETERLSARCCG
ncbi:hypothetical protein [Actinomadura keratinilytica]|jgi:hypothetical protein|uniref:Uncharacterized protein n=1 Tax=Actinomadura keratinilytica TaxID=547461 RepID=A0ABP7ZH36_9ACTN